MESDYGSEFSLPPRVAKEATYRVSGIDSGQGVQGVDRPNCRMGCRDRSSGQGCFCGNTQKGEEMSDSLFSQIQAEHGTEITEEFLRAYCEGLEKKDVFDPSGWTFLGLFA